MDVIFFIRSLIFLVAGLVVILFPEKVYKFQVYILKKLHIKYNITKHKDGNKNIGIVFIIISVLLFVYAISK